MDKIAVWYEVNHQAAIWRPSNEGSGVQQNVVNAIIVQNPKHYEEAIKSDHRKQWLTAMAEELDALKSNDVWTIVMPSESAHVLHNK